MKLHLEQEAFQNAILFVATNSGIPYKFIEKDYWISLILKRLSDSEHAVSVVFKGGTSLLKGFRLIDRFSEDVDLAVINTAEMTGNQIKSLIRKVEKEISRDLTEIAISGVTSKGSRFRKAVYSYQQPTGDYILEKPEKSVIIEINSFGNASPWQKVEIQSMIGQFFEKNGRDDLVSKFGLQAFSLNALDKNRTLIEKLSSLIRFSFSPDPLQVLSMKIRHFYDIFFLINTAETKTYLKSENFLPDLLKVIENDKESFDEPDGWKFKEIQKSPVVQDFDILWEKLRLVYTREIPLLAFNKIPKEKEVAETFKGLISVILNKPY